MRKIILIFVTIVLPCLLCARNDDKSTDMLLREIDGIIKNRQTYGAEKEARISDLKKLLSEATSDEQRYGFCGRLFDEYRAYNLDSSYVYARISFFIIYAEPFFLNLAIKNPSLSCTPGRSCRQPSSPTAL